jgi:Ser/Thr protein kinase RdoA (MazF antagonist)
MGSRAGRAASTPSRHVGHPATRALTHAKVAWSPFSSTSSPTVGSIRRLQAAAFVRFTMRSRTSTASFRTATIRIARALLDSLEPSDDVDFLRELVAQELPAVQALHGDAHLGNCLQTTTESLWHDFETACRGPREYDLAALVMRHRQAGDPRAWLRCGRTAGTTPRPSTRHSLRTLPGFVRRSRCRCRAGRNSPTH